MQRRSEDPLVTPEGWLHRGEAYVSGDGVQLAVFGGIPGEQARVRLTGTHRRQDRARWVGAVGRTHPARVEPYCDRYVPCGRCPLMHLHPDAQHDVIRGLVQDGITAAELNGRVDPVLPLHPAGATTNRQELQYELNLVAGYSDRQSPRIGVPGHDGRDVVPVPACTMVPETLRETMKVLAHHVRELEIWPWTGKVGTLRAVQLRCSPITGDVGVLLSVARPSAILSELAIRLASAHPPIAGVAMHISQPPGYTWERDEDGELGVAMLYGKALLDIAPGGFPMRLGFSDPWPARPDEPALLDAIAALRGAQGDAALEIGGANGVGALLLAKQTGWAMSLGLPEARARRARENNAAANGTGSGADFVSGPVIEGLATVYGRLEGRRPLVLLNAGTKGIPDEVIDAVLALEPRRVALLGSNPRAFGKNLARLTANLRVVRVTPHDVAPNTPFAEVVGVLESDDKSLPTARAPRRKVVR
jgi:23S rRNA (uracil1939-C5)-methyltransferase